MNETEWQGKNEKILSLRLGVDRWAQSAVQEREKERERKKIVLKIEREEVILYLSGLDKMA